MRWSGHDVFVADLHLSGSQPALCKLAHRFLTDAEGARRLFILGDLVEYWIGDDVGTAALELDGDPLLQSVLDALQQLSATGTDIHLMHGNRDFLLGKSFAGAVGATLHTDDTLIIEAAGERWLLMHGDTLCTDDTDYSQWRTVLRSRAWQQEFLARTPEERRSEAQRLRGISKEAAGKKDTRIMDVNDDAVVEAMQVAGTQRLLHGHTHRPAAHAVSLKDQPEGQRIVLGDWHAQGAMIAVADEQAVQLIHYP